MAQQLKGLAWLALTIGVGTAIAVGLPFFAKHLPWSVERRAATYLDSFGKDVCADGTETQSKQLFDTILRRLYPIYPDDKNFPLTVEPIHGATINAFASFDGRVYVYDGLLQQAESPEELAGVLAHEIEHVKDRHIMQDLAVRLSTFESLRLLFGGDASMGPQIARLLLNTRFSRTQEREADEGGLKRLRDAHIDSAGFEHFFERASDGGAGSSFLSDHPANDDRAAMARQYRASNPKPILTPQEWRAVKTVCR